MRIPFVIGAVIFVGSLIIISAWKNGLTKDKSIVPQESVGYAPHPDMSGEGFLANCEEHLSVAKRFKELLVKEKDSKNTFIKTLHIYNTIQLHMDTASSQAGLLAQVHPREEVRNDAKKCSQLIGSFATELSLDDNVYKVLLAGINADLDHDAKRLLELTLSDFRRSGVNRDQEARMTVKSLSEELLTIGQEFVQNISHDRLVIYADNADELDGLPIDYINAHKSNAQGKIEISTDYPDYIPFMKYAKSDKLRKELHYKYLNRGQNNGPVLKKMIEKRFELAKILGYASYADYVVEDKMIKSVSAVRTFLEKIAKTAKTAADKEYQALLTTKRRTGDSAQVILGHESTYFQELYNKETFNFSSQDVRPYFSYERVRDGLLELTSEIYNIKYVPVMDAKVWHESVSTYDVYDKNGKLGRIYLDMHPRPGKYEHAAQFPVQKGLKDRQYPESALICNLPNPKEGNGIALMEHAQVITMFHEFGHLLHHIFSGNQEWVAFSGISTEFDFVEAPAQFFEEWAWSETVLQRFARHYQNNEVIPSDLVKRMRAASEFGKALYARQQVFYASLSLNYFNKIPSSFDMLETLKELQAKYSYFPYREGTHFHYSFGHLENYSAMYYTYIWSLVIAKDLFSPFKREGLMNKEYAERFREKILNQGARQSAADLVKDFLGRPFNFDAYEQWLNTEPAPVNH